MALRPLRDAARGIAGLLMLVLALSCGARTGLEQPCDLPLERVRPSVLFLLARGGELGIETPYFRRFGRPLGVLFRQELQDVGPDVAEAARFGVLVHPENPPFNPPMWDSCQASSRLDLAMGVHAAPAMADVWFRHGHFLGPPPHDPACCWGLEGPDVVGPNLPLAATSLRADVQPGGEMFLVLATASHGGCGPFREWADNLPPVLRQITELRRYGIRTMVVGLDPAIATSTEYYLSYLAQMAVAGGLARTDGRLSREIRREEFPFVDAWDPAQVRLELRRRVLSSYWCRGTVGGDWDLSRPDLVVRRADGREIARDPTHRNGWDHDGAHFVTLYGPTCHDVQDDRQEVHFLRPTERCP